VLAWKWPEPLAWAVCLAISLILSLGFGLLIAPGLAKREPVVKAVATLGFALCLLGLMNLVWVVTPRRLGLSSDTISIGLAGLRFNATRLIALSIGIVATIGMGIFLARTRVGLLMRALADNREVASTLGIPIVRVEALAWGISGLMAGFTGLMMGDLVRLDPVVLTFLVIQIIATTVVGRLKSIPATFVAGLAIGIVESMLTLVKPLAPLRVAAPFVIAIIALMWLQRRRQLTFAGED
jgi:branched-chain amino acid transport system permease protein